MSRELTVKQHDDPSTLATYLDHALAGRVRPAVGVTLGLLDRGVPVSRIVTDLLVPAQLEVGRRWQRNELSVADEHLATGSAEAAVHALAMAHATPQETRGQVLLACAEGDWHASASHMFALQLADAGFGVKFLGASTPAAHVASLIARRPPDALIVSCTMPIHFAGVTRLVNAAHSHGLPVLLGGGALVKDGQERARRLGGDGWAQGLAGAVATLDEWNLRPPAVPAGPTALPADALYLEREAPSLAVIAEQGRAARAAAKDEESRRAGLVGNDLELVLRFLAAAHMVESDEVFMDFLRWLEPVLTTRGLPEGKLRTEVESLVPLIPSLPLMVTLLNRGASSLPISS